MALRSSRKGGVNGMGCVGMMDGSMDRLDARRWTGGGGVRPDLFLTLGSLVSSLDALACIHRLVRFRKPGEA